MPRKWPWNRKRRRGKQRSPKELKALFDLRESKRRAARREEFLAYLQESDPEAYRQVMAEEMKLGGLFSTPDGGGEFEMGGEFFMGLFQRFLEQKLVGDEDELDKLFDRIEQMEEIRRRVEPQSREGLSGLITAVGELFKGPAGAAFVQGLMATKQPQAAPTTIAAPQGTTPLLQADSGQPASPLAAQQEELPMLPDWIPLDRLPALLEQSPEEAAKAVLLFAVERYNQGHGDAIQGLATLAKLPPLIVRLSLRTYQAHPQYGQYVGLLLARGEWVEQFLASLNGQIEAMQRGEDIWQTTSASSEAQPESTMGL